MVRRTRRAGADSRPGSLGIQKLNISILQRYTSSLPSLSAVSFREISVKILRFSVPRGWDSRATRTSRKTVPMVGEVKRGGAKRMGMAREGRRCHIREKWIVKGGAILEHKSGHFEEETTTFVGARSRIVKKKGSLFISIRYIILLTLLNCYSACSFRFKLKFTKTPRFPHKKHARAKRGAILQTPMPITLPKEEAALHRRYWRWIKFGRV